jgi:hypothetical protein
MDTGATFPLNGAKNTGPAFATEEAKSIDTRKIFANLFFFIIGIN